jgi:hypothetical protein
LPALVTVQVSQQALAMEDHKQEYNRLREQLRQEMYTFATALRQMSEEDMMTIGPMLEHVNESSKRLLAQVQLYSAFVMLKINIKQITESVPQLLG